MVDRLNVRSTLPDCLGCDLLQEVVDLELADAGATGRCYNNTFAA